MCRHLFRCWAHALCAQTFRQYVKVDDIARKILSIPELRSDVLVIALLVRLYVNIDYLKSKKVKGAPVATTSETSRRARLSRADYGGACMRARAYEGLVYWELISVGAREGPPSSLRLLC